MGLDCLKKGERKQKHMKTNMTITQSRAALKEADPTSKEAGELHAELSDKLLKKDSKQALREALKADKLGCPKGTKIVAAYYAKRAWDSANRDLAVTYMERLGEIGDAEDKRFVADFYWTEVRDPEKYLAWAKAAADAGSLQAILDYGNALLDGDPFPSDYKTGISYLEKAADAGLTEALYDLGVCYNNGEGAPKDDQKAFEHFLKAAEKGDARAQFETYRMYGNGVGCQTNLKEALRWLSAAAEQKHPLAVHDLAVAYDFGDLGVKDEKKADAVY